MPVASVRLRSRDGRIIKVTEEQADKLLRTGQWQMHTSTARPPSTSSFGVIGTGDLGPSSSHIDTGVDRFDATIYQPWEPEPVKPEDPAAENPRADNNLTTEQWRQIVAFEENMKENEDLFWHFKEGENGEVENIFARKAIARDFANDLEDRGWTDRMIGAVTDFYYGYTTDNRLAPSQDFGDIDTSLPGGGGGGGRLDHVYIKPDRNATEAAVKGMLLTYTGEFTDQRVAELADEWEAAHRADWDVQVNQVEGSSRVDPNLAVMETIRGQADYRKAHALRSDADDEARWIGDRRMRLNQLGVTGDDADDRAIRLAQLGTGIGDIDTGAFQNSKGRDDITLMNQLAKSAELVAGVL